MIIEFNEGQSEWVERNWTDYYYKNINPNGVHSFHVHVYNVDGQTIGGLSGTYFNQYCHIESFIIDEKFRRKGVGSLLLNKLDNIFKNRGITLISLETSEAKEFYIKNNYIVILTYPDFYGPKKDKFLMQKRLDIQ